MGCNSSKNIPVTNTSNTFKEINEIPADSIERMENFNYDQYTNEIEEDALEDLTPKVSENFQICNFETGDDLVALNKRWFDLAKGMKLNNLEKNIVYPHGMTKDTFFNENIFYGVDEIAEKFNLNSILNLTILEFIQNVVNKFSDDVRKCRLIYRVLTFSKIENITEDLLSGNFSTFNYQLYLLKIHASTFADLFAYLCNLAGIQCRIVKGHIKTMRDGIYNKLDESMISDWNIVRLLGFWFHVDAFGGSLERIEREFRDKSSDEREEKKTSLNEYFFLTNPGYLIHTHLPLEPKYQLLARKVNYQEFLQIKF